jgi:hypothetical protein
MVVLICDWLRISITTQGATPAALTRGRAVAGVVQPDRAEADGLGDPGEGAVQVARLDRAACAGGEDIVRVLPPLPCLGARLRLPDAMPALGRDAEGGQWDGQTTTARGVVVQDATAALDLAADV